MFDIASSELLLVVLVALLVIGPKDLPKALRVVGKWVGKARGVAAHFRSGFDEMVRQSEIEELEKKWKAENERIMREHPADPRADVLGDDAAPAADAPAVATVAQPELPIDPPSAGSQGMNDIDDSKMPLLDHLIELRSRLLWSFLALAIAFGVSLYFARPIFGFLVQPLLESGQKTLIYTAIFEAFFVEIKVAFFAAGFFSFPVFATQLWRFVAPGLYNKEKRAFLPFLLATPVLFILGASMAYYMAIPVALEYLLGFGGNVGGVEQQALPGVDNYLNFVMKFIFGFGVSFLLPVLLMLLERAGIVTLEQLRGARRYAIVGAFAIAAVLTPPDVVSQLLLAIPLCILFEMALVAIWFTRRRRAKAEAAEEVVT